MEWKSMVWRAVKIGCFLSFEKGQVFGAMAGLVPRHVHQVGKYQKLKIHVVL